jgi:hypothetical protein
VLDRKTIWQSHIGFKRVSALSSRRRPGPASRAKFCKTEFLSVFFVGFPRLWVGS